MSYFKQCEKCGKEINSYDSTLCKNCLDEETKCVDCGKPINVNEFYHRASLCSPCEEKREKKHSELREKSDHALEDMWQGQCMTIKMALMKAYDDKTPKEESDRCMILAQEAQKKQSKIQDEITRRH